MTGSPTEPPIATTSNISRAKCPTCGKPTDVGFRPFCSKRCADVDLNRWFTGAYAVPSEKEHLDEFDTPEAD